MRLLRFVLLVPLVLWTCATPPQAPTPVPTPPAPAGPDDDHRVVTYDEFRQGPWQPMGAATAWKVQGAGVALTLAGGREAWLGFVAPGVVRWWVPAGSGDQALSPTVRYPAAPPAPKVREEGGVLVLETPGLALSLRLADLTWTLTRGDKTAFRTEAPRVHGRRLDQAWTVEAAQVWTSPALDPGQGGARTWADTGFDLPAFTGLGGPLPVAVFLDSTYQAYLGRSADRVSLGALNGGLDLLVSSAPRLPAALEALSALVGRSPVPPAWAVSGLVPLAPADSGLPFRQAKLSLGAALGPSDQPRPRFATFADPLVPPVPPVTDWNLAVDVGGQYWIPASGWPRLSALAAARARTVAEKAAPRARPLVLTPSGTAEVLRWARPQVTVAAGRSGPALARHLAWSAAGLGLPAVRLDLAALADPALQEAAFRDLTSWLLVPVATFDLGPDAAASWKALPEPARQRLKALLARRSALEPWFAQLTRAEAGGQPAWVPVGSWAPADPLALASPGWIAGDTVLSVPLPASGPQVPVYLPGPGVWFEFYTGEEFDGGRSYDLDVPTDRPLLFVKGGGFVPTREPQVYDEKAVYNPLTVHVFPGGRGVGEYYLDDGLSPDFQTGTYWKTVLAYTYSQREMVLDHETDHSTNRLDADPYLLYRLHNVYRPKQVKIDGKAIPLYGDSWGITDTDRSAAWYEADHTLLIKTFRPERNQTILMSF